MCVTLLWSKVVYPHMQKKQLLCSHPAISSPLETPSNYLVPSYLSHIVLSTRILLLDWLPHSLEVAQGKEIHLAVVIASLLPAQIQSRWILATFAISSLALTITLD
ncbi:unnamed protein product [Cylicostephanus goldi]|uniref:Uncharacterized protein n=1 Tax=Cylicostephanus goldi TaxID=71465 RepID=A0A3P6ST35_CYLGO|nr:unnamed protein product [Cylicostephanus goldi]